MWFTETPWPPIFLLLSAAVVLAVAWTRNGRGAFAAGAVACLLLAGVAFVAERLIVTPAEEVEALVYDLRDAVVRDDVEGTLAFFSPAALKEQLLVRTAMALGRPTADLRITDLTVETGGDDTLAESVFRANGTVEGRHVGGSHHVATRWRLNWRREADAWRIIELNRLDPINGDPIEITSGD